MWKEEVVKGSFSALLHTGYWRVYDITLLEGRLSTGSRRNRQSTRHAVLRNNQQKGYANFVEVLKQPQNSG